MNDVQGSYSWRVSAVAAAGLDYLYDNWLIGAQMRFETFDSSTGGLTWAGRFGYRFGK